MTMDLSREKCCESEDAMDRANCIECHLVPRTGDDGLCQVCRSRLAKIEDLCERAKEIGAGEGSLSVSMLQRRLGTGYVRSCEIMERLDAAGLLGDQLEGSPRRTFRSAP